MMVARSEERDKGIRKNKKLNVRSIITCTDELSCRNLKSQEVSIKKKKKKFENRQCVIMEYSR